jgi:hypothetical protein
MNRRAAPHAGRLLQGRRAIFALGFQAATAATSQAVLQASRHLAQLLLLGRHRLPQLTSLCCRHLTLIFDFFFDYFFFSGENRWLGRNHGRRRDVSKF